MVELLAVVAMIGILAALAITGYKKYITSAKIGQAKDTIGAIRIAQESYKAETLNYLSCSSSLTDWYPATPNGKKRHWVWPSDTVNKPTWPTPTEPWYVIQAAGDGDEDANGSLPQMSLFVASSFTGEIYVENETE